MPHIRLYQGEASPSDVSLRSVPGIANTNLPGSISFIGGENSLTSRTLVGATLSFIGSAIKQINRSLLGSLLFTGTTDPSNISGLKLWLKTDSLSLNDGDAITAWTDSSGSGNNAIGGSFGNSTYKTNIQNGKAIARFNGTSSGLRLPANVVTAQPITVFTVVSQTSKATTGVLLDTTAGTLEIIRLTTNGFLQIRAGHFLIDAVDHSGTFHVFTTIFNGASSFGYVDGSQVISGDAGTLASGTMIIGYDGANFLTGDIGEVLVYDSALSTNNQQKIESYLSVKYNISGPPLVTSGGYGTLVKNTRKLITPTLSFIGNFIYPWKQVAALSFVGSVIRQAQKSLSGSYSFIGIKLNQTSKPLTGTSSFIGLCLKGVSRALSATLNFVGSLAKQTRRVISAALSFIGSLFKRTNKTMSGSQFFNIIDFLNLTRDGNFQLDSLGSIKIGQSFTGTGNYIDSVSFLLGKLGSPTGNAVATIYAHSGSFGGGGIPTGSALATSDPFDVSTIIALNRFSTLRFPSGFFAVNGTHYFAILEYSGGDLSNAVLIGVCFTDVHPGNDAFYTTSWSSNASQDIPFIVTSVSLTKQIYHLLSAALNFIGSISKYTGRTISSTLTLTGSLVKRTGKALIGILDFIGSPTKKIFRTVSGVLSSIGSLISSELNVLLLTATLAFSGAFSKRTGKLLTGLLSFTGVISKFITRTFATVLNFVGNLITQLTHAGSYFISFAANLGFIGALNKLTDYLVAGSLSFIGSTIKQCYNLLPSSLGSSGVLIKQTRRILVSTMSFVGVISMIRMIMIALAATISFVGAIVKHTNKSLFGSYSFMGSMYKYVSHSFVSALSPIGALGKRIPVLLNATLSFIGVLSSEILAHVYYILVEGTLLFVGGINRSIFRPIIGILAIYAEISKFTSRDFSGSLYFIVRFIQWASFNKIWSVEIPTPPVFTAQAILSPITITATILKP